jgi:hypothetical protein
MYPSAICSGSAELDRTPITLTSRLALKSADSLSFIFLLQYLRGTGASSGWANGSAINPDERISRFFIGCDGVLVSKRLISYSSARV